MSTCKVTELRRGSAHAQCFGCGVQVAGYTYAADLYCEHCTAVMFERADDDAPNIFAGAEAISRR